MLLRSCRKVVLCSRGPSFPTAIISRSLFKSSAASRPGFHAHLKCPKVGFGALALAGLLSGSGYVYYQSTRPALADAYDVDGDGDKPFRQPYRPQTPLRELIRTYIVYSMCSIPTLVDHSHSILSTLLSIPGISYITEAFVRATFFSQFVGGDTALGTLPLLEKLRSENKGTLFAYSVEVDEEEAAGKGKFHSSESGHAQPVHKRIIDEMIRCIDVAADFEDQRRNSANASGRRTWVAVKLTALVPDAQALINFSKYLVETRPPTARPICFPGSPRPSDFDVFDIDPADLPETCPLSKEDIDALREMKEDLFRVCQRAKERGVKIIIDAEHSWYQPAIDAYQRALMAEFNRLPPKISQPSVSSRAIGKRFYGSSTETGLKRELLMQPLVYGTFQAYLRRTEHLAQSIVDAEAGNYALGVKLVRGAYHPLEVSAHATRRFVDSESKAAVSSTSGFSSPSISAEEFPPVWERKEETDMNYNTCARVLIKLVAGELAEIDSVRRAGRGSPVPRVGILFGTHNRESCDLILEALVDEGLATRTREDGLEVTRIPDDVAERITLAQLYGTRDELTDSLVERTRSTDPFVIKYVPYGMLSEVMPYLARRAIENKSVLGNGVAQEERRRAGSKIVKRIFSFFR